MPGGFVRHIDAGVLSYDTADFVRAFRFDVAVVAVSGIDGSGEMGDDDPGEVMAVRAAMGRAERTILAVDASKFTRLALVRLGSITAVDVLVTDADPPPLILALLAQAGVLVEVV